MKVYTLNGIKDSAATTTDRIGGEMESIGYEWKPLRYRTAHTWTARSKRAREQTAEGLLNQVEPGGILMAHSFGCLLSWHMLDLWEHRRHEAEHLFSHVFLFSPAMNRTGWHWERLDFETLHCFHNPNDIAILLGSINPFHPFGAAGRKGFVTEDKRVHNVSVPSKVGPWNHSDPWFAGFSAQRWARAIDTMIWQMG